MTVSGRHDGFLTRVYSQAVKHVGESSLAMIDEGDRVALELAMRQQLAAMERQASSRRRSRTSSRRSSSSGAWRRQRG